LEVFESFPAKVGHWQLMAAKLEQTFLKDRFRKEVPSGTCFFPPES
jgi:hypothetical protein